MLERQIEYLTDTTDFLEFFLRFGISPRDPEARYRVYDRLLFNSLNPQIKKDRSNMYVSLAKKYGLTYPDKK